MCFCFSRRGIISFVPILAKGRYAVMAEKLYGYKKGDEKVIERIIEDDNVAINHMILRRSESLPEHYSNSSVYMIVVRGQVSLKLDDREEHSYPEGSIINIPYQTKMNVSNQHDEIMEIFVVKAPSPKNMSAE